MTLPVFSMRNLLSPLLEKPGSVLGPLMVVVVEVTAPAGWLTDVARAEHSRMAREWLQRCLHSDEDVLLPKMGSAGSSELIFIVASTDRAGGDALIARIRERFEQREQEQASGLKLAISSHLIPAARANKNISKSVSHEAVAAAIQALVNGEFSSRMVANA